MIAVWPVPASRPLSQIRLSLPQKRPSGAELTLRNLDGVPRSTGNLGGGNYVRVGAAHVVLALGALYPVS